MADGFVLDSRLENDSFLVKDLELSQLRLMNDKRYPWLILVPKITGLRELVDLDDLEYDLLQKEIKTISKYLLTRYNPDKLNIANISNIVEQLHIHIVVRFFDDEVWPAPVWGNGERQEYSKVHAEELIREFQIKL